MNASNENNPSNTVYLGLGSDIDPERNIARAIVELRKKFMILDRSRIWESAPVGRSGAMFLNCVVLIQTTDSLGDLRFLLRQVEKKLGRVRSSDKNAPRQIDIDILIYSGEIYDPDIWSQAYLALPLADVFPDLLNPINGFTIKYTSEYLRKVFDINPRDDIECK